jgi:hypothetical protein
MYRKVNVHDSDSSNGNLKRVTVIAAKLMIWIGFVDQTELVQRLTANT